MDSDEDIGRVPEFGLEQRSGQSTSGREQAVAAAPGTSSSAAQTSGSGRRRGRSPADKEHRRLKRYASYCSVVSSHYSLVSTQ